MCRKLSTNAAASVDDADTGRFYRNAKALLMRKTEEGKTDHVVVPECLKAFILRRYHGLPVSGHVGRRRTYKQISSAYYWPDMSKDVKRWVQACLACRRRKTPRPLHAGQPGAVSTATRPWQCVAIDIVSTTTTSQGGYTKILTMIDLFTRYVIATPLRKATAKNIGSALFEQLYCRFGKPERIHSDEGSEFVSEALKAMFKEWDIKHTSTGGYQPQANPVERYHRFMNSSMTMLAAKFGANWPQYLPATTFAYNASTNDATGYSPHELVHAGQKPTLLQSIGELHANEPEAANEADHHKLAGTRLRSAYRDVRTTQERIAKARRDAILKKRGQMQKKSIVHEVGDHVLFWEPAQPVKLQTPEQQLSNVWVTRAPQKWKSRWSGPHRITGRKADRTGHRYILDHRKRGQIETHVNKLCSFQPWSPGLLSTSWDIDTKIAANSRTGEWVSDGELVLIPLNDPVPFGLARVLDCDANGNLKLQWMANDDDNPHGTFKPGWTPRGAVKPYFDNEKRAKTHREYTAALDAIEINQRDVVIHSFKLTDDQRLPKAILEAVSAHDCIWWTKAENQAPQPE